MDPLVLGALVTEGGGSRLDRLPHRIRASILWPIALDGPAAVARAVLNHPELARLRRGAFSRR